jgi:hypothetical protein
MCSESGLSGGSSIIWLRSSGTDSAATYDGRSIAQGHNTRCVSAPVVELACWRWRGGLRRAGGEGAKGSEPDVHHIKKASTRAAT